MRFFLLSFLFLASCVSRSAYYADDLNLASIHLVDRDGLTEAISNEERLKNFEEIDFFTPQPYQKVLRVFGRDVKGDTRAYITTYHPNGQIKQYLEVINNRACGAYREWHLNGKIKVEATIIEGSADINRAAEKSWLFDGPSKAYGENGELIACINYCRGSLEGISLYYHSNGSIWKEIPYKNNAISGEVRIYLDSGALFQTMHYENGLKSGKALRYWPDLMLAANEYYDQGGLINGIYLSQEGIIIAEIKQGNGYRAVFSKEVLSELHEYHSGFPQGEVKIFNALGHLSRIYHVKNDLKHGEELFYYPSCAGELKPKLSISWYEGKIQGLVKSWYDNQAMESQREMSENKRNGVSTAWYRDGQLMMIEQYENEVLKKGDYYRKGYKQPLSQVLNGEGTVTLFDSEGNYLRKIPYLNGKPD